MFTFWVFWKAKIMKMYVNLDQGHTEHTFSTLLVITDSEATPNAEHLAIFTQHFTITLYIFYNYAIYLLKKKNNFNKFLCSKNNVSKVWLKVGYFFMNFLLYVIRYYFLDFMIKSCNSILSYKACFYFYNSKHYIVSTEHKTIRCWFFCAKMIKLNSIMSLPCHQNLINHWFINSCKCSWKYNSLNNGLIKIKMFWCENYTPFKVFHLQKFSLCYQLFFLLWDVNWIQ